MTKRDLILLAIGSVLAGLGVLFAAFGYTNVALISLIIFALFVLLLMLLQRRQLGVLQKRTLEVLRSNSGNEAVKVLETAPSDPSEVSDVVLLSTKKLIGLLHAQQIQIDELTKKVSDLVDQTRSS